METETTFLVDWFRVSDVEHLNALKHRLDKSSWPKHFIPADVTCTENDVSLICIKIAREWIKTKTAGPTMRSDGPYPLEFGGQSRER